MTAAPMANDIIDSGPEVGFMNGGWWRPKSTQTPANARIMEHISTLSWFYANERAWNSRGAQLYRSSALLVRLEAAVDYYTSLQFADGAYPEYRGERSLAATTFGIVAQADTYEALRAVDGSATSRRQLEASIVSAVRWFMDDDAAHWKPPVRYFNQVVAGLVGAQRALQVLDQSPASQERINSRISYICTNGVAPAGFPHEPLGVDFGYNFTVAMPDLAWLHKHTGHPGLVPLVKRYMSFMRYEVIPEPGTDDLSHVPALHGRNVVSAVIRPADDLNDRAALAKVFLHDVPSIGLFLPTREEKDESRAAFRASVQPLRVLAKPNTSPRTWMYAPLAPAGPTLAQRQALEAHLPVLQKRAFTHLDNGSEGDTYQFVRRPKYYTVGVFGEHPGLGLSTRQLGTLWHPKMGTVLVGTNSPDVPEGWETVGPSSAFSTRKSSSKSTYFDGMSLRDREIGATDVPHVTSLFAQHAVSAAEGDYSVLWRYWDDGIGFTFRTGRSGKCLQRIPLLLKAGDTLTFSDGSVFEEGGGDQQLRSQSVLLERASRRLLLTYGSAPRKTWLRRSPASIAGGAIHRLTVEFESQLDVDMAFLDDDAASVLMAEAHANGAGDVSLRVVLLPAIRGAVDRLRIVEEGSSTISVAGSAYEVIEQTLPGRAARGPITLDALDTNSRRVARVVVPIG